MSEMRQRKKESSEVSDELPESPNSKASKVYDAIICKAPSSLTPYLSSAGPYVIKSVVVLQELLPLVYTGYEQWGQLMVTLEPYHVHLLMPAFCGIIMCFFGGSYFTLIAAVEAYRMCGYKTSLDAINSIADDMKAFIKASEKDDQVDDDNDGVADVKQITAAQLAQRKTFLFLKTIDPVKMSTALGGLQAGFLAVIATLKLQFAKALTLGSAVADVLEKPADAYLVPALEAGIPGEYSKWAGPIVHSMIRTTTVSIAWWLQRVISALHSAIRGGVMASRNICQYVTKMGWANINTDETLLDEIVGYGLAATGFLFQLSYGFRLPFPLNLLLLPFTLLEYILMWCLSLK